VFKRVSVFGAVLLVMLAVAGVAFAGTNALRNGDFQTGNLAYWTPYTTANGTNGAGLPNVVPFNTTGFSTSNAAHFNVGEVTFIPGDYEGGGIYQSFYDSSTLPESFAVSADIAALAPVGNISCGFYELMVDGSDVASYNISNCLGGTVYRHHLSGTIFLSGIGWHTVTVQIRRPFISVIGLTPDEYVDNVSAVAKLSKVLTPTAPVQAAAPVVAAPGAPSTGVVNGH
jgi:hypothetical protein